MKKYDEMTSKELKVLAKEKSIANWWTLKKEVLISELSILDICEAALKAEKEQEIKMISKSKTKSIKTHISSSSFLLRHGALTYSYKIGDQLFEGAVADLLEALEQYELNYVNTKCYKETGKYIVSKPGKKLIAALVASSKVEK